jgi:hypothetical protein
MFYWLGLYAESHGIVGNDFWDPLWQSEYSINNVSAVNVSFEYLVQLLCVITL